MLQDKHKSELYFRAQPNGAVVFRVAINEKTSRMDFKAIANVVTQNGNIRIRGNNEVSASEMKQIEDWVQQYNDGKLERFSQEINQAKEALNLLAHDMQKISELQSESNYHQKIETGLRELLIAIQDLQQELVLRKARARE